MTSPEVDQELARLLMVTRAATAPDAEARSRIRGGIALKLASGAAVAGGAGALASAGGFSKWKWLSFGGAVIGLGAFAWWLSAAPRSAVAPVATGQTRTLDSVIEAPAAQLPPAVVAAPSPEPSGAAPTAAPAVASAAEPSGSPRPAAPAARANASSKTAETGRPEPAASASPDPAEELQLVRSMQQALRSGNASEALRLADEHARRFPAGTLAQEREGVRAIARCQLAKPEARAGILERFNQSFGSSPYAARVKAACQ